MKKILFNSFIALSFFSSIDKIQAQCSFDQVGAANFSTTSLLSDMAVAPDNKVYTVAFNSTSNKIQLQKGMTSSSWTLTSAISTTTTVKPAISISKTNKVYIFISDGLAGNVGKVYYLSGVSLIQLGGNVSAGAVSDLSIAFDASGVEYIAYTDIANANKTTVKKWDGISNWINVGSGVVSPAAGRFNSLIIDNSTNKPSISFQDGNLSNAISVYKFDGTSWSSAFQTPESPSTNSVLKGGNNGNYYLGYTSGTSAYVKMYDGVSWSALGGAISNISSGANSFDLDLDPLDVPYIVAVNSSTTSSTAQYFRFTWTQLVGGPLTNTTTLNTNIAIDNTGTPYFSYVDGNGNNDLNVKTLTSPISISTQPLSTQQICDGSAGSFSITVAGGTPTYQWQSATTGAFANAGAPYTNASTNILSFSANPSINQNKIRCIVDAGCKYIVSNTSTLTVLNNPTVNLTTTNPSCFGTCNGMITANPIGGTAPYTFSWSPTVGSSATLPSLCAGTYSVLVKDANNCSVSANANLFSPSGISSSVSGNLTICSGNSTTLTLTAAGGTPGYTFSWSPGATLSSTNTAVVVATPTITTTYTANVTDANGCIKSTSVTVTVNALPAVSAGPDNSICLGGSAVNSATGAHTYTWNPGNFVGANQNVTPFSTTTYTVVGTNTLTGCTNSDFKIVTVNPNPTVNAISSPTSICAGSTSTLTASGAVTYTWNPGAITGVTATVSPASTTVYTLTGMAATGCSNTKTLSLTVNPNPTITAVSSPTTICAGSSATLTGSGASTYTWMPGALTGSTINVSPASNIVYTVTGIAATGCSNTNTLSLIVNPNPIATASTSGSLTCTTSTVNLNSGAVAGGTYLWSGPSFTSTLQNPTTSMPGSYTVLVTNSGTGCSSSAVTSVISNYSVPSVTGSVSNSLSCVATTANVMATTTTSPVSYAWAGTGIITGAGTATITVNSGGIKNYTITNTINGCATTGTLSVSQNTTTPATTVSITGTLTCTTPTVNLNSSLAGMTYSWTAPGGASVSSANTQNTIGSGAGTYSLAVVNPSNGCSYSITTSVSQNTTIPTINGGLSYTMTCSTPNATLNISSSADPVANYSWTSPGGGSLNNNTINNPIASGSGVFTVSVTDAVNGCINTGTVEVIADAAIPTVTLSSNSATITCASTIVSVSVTSTLSADYNWTPTSGIIAGTETTATPSFSAPGSYSAVVTNTVNGCSTFIGANVVTVFQDQSIPTVTLSSNSATLTCLTPTVMVTSTVTPSSNIFYSWTPSAPSFSSPGTYSLVVTNTINGCASSLNICTVVADTAPPTTTISGNTNICKGSTTSITASGASSYLWDNGASTTSISVSPTITTGYTVTGTNPNGCTGIFITTVNIVSAKSITGVITNTNGATGGDVILYKYTSALSQWDSVTITPIGASYSFTNIDSALYVVRAVPTATNIQVTYGASSISWQNATVITHGCSNNTNQDITLIPLESFTAGPGVLTGTITEASGFGHRISSGLKPLAPGGPIGGIVVKGGRNPGGQMFVQTTTNSAGQYTLTGLPIGNDYFVLVDIPGLDTNGTYHVVIPSSGNTQIDGLNFTVDSIYINPIGSVTGISQENSILNNKILMFPNPARQYVSIQYELIQSANVQIELYDIIGKKVKTITEVNRQEKNKYNHMVNLENLSSGIYFVKLKINNSENVIKLIVND